jgi:hypothetical protein
MLNDKQLKINSGYIYLDDWDISCYYVTERIVICVERTWDVLCYGFASFTPTVRGKSTTRKVNVEIKTWY